MSGRHAALVVPGDIWLTDQIDAWLTEMDDTTGKLIESCRADLGAGKSLEQLVRSAMERDEVKTALLCKARLLLGEVARRA